MKILLAEDNPINQRVASLMFNQLGFNCDIASNGQEAFEMHKANEYDLIFMDLQMPVLDGFEATRLIRTHEKSNGSEETAFIVALTGNDYSENKVLSSESGMNDFFEKPIRVEKLHAFLSALNNKA